MPPHTEAPYRKSNARAGLLQNNKFQRYPELFNENKPSDVEKMPLKTTLTLSDHPEIVSNTAMKNNKKNPSKSYCQCDEKSALFPACSIEG